VRSPESLIFMRPLHEGEIMSYFKSLVRFRGNLVKASPDVFLEVLRTCLSLRFINSRYKSTVKS
jgi:hypothetical protein